jgi:hypothetical protein
MEESQPQSLEQLYESCKSLRSELDIILKALQEVRLEKIDDGLMNSRLRKLSDVHQQFKDLGRLSIDS